MIDSQFWRYKPFGTPFRYIYFGIIRLEDNDLFASGAVFGVRLHAAAMNCVGLCSGIKFTIWAVVTFEFADFFFIHINDTSPKEAVAAERRHGSY